MACSGTSKAGPGMTKFKAVVDLDWHSKRHKMAMALDGVTCIAVCPTELCGAGIAGYAIYQPAMVTTAPAADFVLWLSLRVLRSGLGAPRRYTAISKHQMMAN